MHDLVGKYVKDTNGVELGEIIELKDGYFEMEEGLFGTYYLDARMVVSVGDDVTLDASIQTVLHDMKVLDKDGVVAGTVHDVMEADDVMDFILINAGEKLLSVSIENIHRIGETIELNIDLEEIRYIQDEHSFREEIIHRIKGFLHLE